MSPARDQFAKTTTRFCTRSSLIVVAVALAPEPTNRPDKPLRISDLKPRRPPTIRQSGYIGKEHNDAASVVSEVTSHSFDNDSSIDIVGERRADRCEEWTCKGRQLRRGRLLPVVA
jgi:hypothetical protein